MVDADRAGPGLSAIDPVDAVDEPRPTSITPEARTAALAAGAPKVPRRVVVWGVVIAAVLALGGSLGERLASSVGLNPSASPTTSAPSTTSTVPSGPGVSPASALLSFVPVRHVRAPHLVLVDQHGHRVSLAGEAGKVVVLTFFDASCADVCPVLAAELRHADADLGALRSRVEFLTVNTDPLLRASSPAPPAVTASGLAALPNWRYLTGPLRTLDAVWRDFGVSISVYTRTRVVVHNDVLYLVDPRGALVARGSPFSDESRRGSYSLPPSLERVAGGALASAVAALLRPHP